jgi:DNA invertase Pin-like site-specific DNA recombinase
LNKQTIAYLRVSTVDQDLGKNKSDILFFANENNLGKVHFVEEKISGAIHWKKRELGSIIESMSEGDHLIVSRKNRRTIIIQ